VATGGRSSGSAAEPDPIRVFLCYRRSDDKNFIGRFYDKLSERFDSENVFRDIDSIPKGTVFAKVIDETLEKVDTVIAMIGPTWHSDRLFDEDDFVRKELLEALQRGLPILPVLIEDTSLPDAAQLPEGLRPLLDIEFARVRADPDFRRDSTDAIDAIASLAGAEKQRRQLAAEAEAKRQRAGAEEAARSRLAAGQATAARLAHERAERTAEIHRLEAEFASRRLAEEQAKLAELTETEKVVAAEVEAADEELRRIQESAALHDSTPPVQPDTTVGPSEAGASGPTPHDRRSGGDRPPGRSLIAWLGDHATLSVVAVVLIAAGLVGTIIAVSRGGGQGEVAERTTPTNAATGTTPDTEGPGTTARSATTGGVTNTGDQSFPGATVRIMGPPTDDDTMNVLNGFADQLQMTIAYEGATDHVPQLGAALAEGRPPDIAVIDRPEVFSELAESGEFVQLPDQVINSLADYWPEDWLDLWNVDGQQFGVPTQAGLRSLVWYVPSTFEAAGYDIPDTLTAFFDLIDTMSAEGRKPLCVGLGVPYAVGSPFTEWVEELVLREEGIDYYKRWISHEVPFEDAGVVNAMEQVADLWASENAYVGGDSINDTSPKDSARALQSGSCMMYLYGARLVPQFPAGTEFGTGPGDVNVFSFPSDEGAPTIVHSVGAVAFNDAPEVLAVMQYLGSPEYADARQIAMSGGLGSTEPTGFLTANQGVNRTLFTDLENMFLDILAAASPAALNATSQMPREIGASADYGNGAFVAETTALANGEKDAAAAAAAIDAAWPN
jgi:alpha-glucoside transport system substrate-binding protein